MRIVIKQTLCPFSHQPGAVCLIPDTTWEARVFPSKAILRDLASSQTAEIDLPFGGSLIGFTVMLNLEKGRIEVFAKGKKRVFLNADSHPALQRAGLTPSKKRLSLGIHKKQDWDLIQRRMDPAEIFPFWVKLAEWIPESPLPQKTVGTMHLLEEGEWESFLLAGFEGILSPRLEDRNYLGLVSEEAIPKGVSPLGLIHLGARKIEALFFQEKGEEISLLSSLPKEFHAGRFIHLETSWGDEFDIEWSKKTIKKIVIRPKREREIRLVLQKKVKHFRTRTDLRKRGTVYSAKDPVQLKPNQVLYIDRFTS